MDILTGIIAVVLLLLFPLGQVARIDLGNGVAIAPLDVGVLIVAIISCFFIINQKRFSKLFLPVGVFVAIGLLGLIMNRGLKSSEFYISLLYLLRFVSYAMVGIAVNILGQKQKIILQKILLVVGGVVVLAGYMQYFLYPSLRNLYYAGWDPHLYRMFSTFLDPNFSGVFFVLYFIFVLYVLFQQKIMWRKITFATIALVTTGAIILTLSRETYIVFGLSTLLYLFLKGYKKIAVVVPLVVITLAILVSFLTPFGEGKNLLRTVSTNARLESDIHAMQIFLKNPVIGVGFDAYRYAQYRYGFITGSEWEASHSGAGVNNSFIFVLATTGIVGGITLGYFWWAVLKKSFYLVKVKKQQGIFLFVSFIALLLSGLFENTLFYPSIMMWMWVLVGFID